ncbi:MAG: hypothetical protein KAT70_04985 [Thermoplasmata archaeon]|nr:hypothetical protein [Thermoplasmata archaeon]
MNARSLLPIVLVLSLVAVSFIPTPASALPGDPPCAILEVRSTDWSTEYEDDSGISLRPYSETTLNINLTSDLSAPGHSENFTITLVNNISDGLISAPITLGGLYDGNRTGVIDPSNSTNFTVIINIPAGMAAENYNLTIWANTTNYWNIHSNTSFHLNVTVLGTPMVGVDTDLPPQSLVMKPGDTDNITVRLKNYGNQGGTVGVEFSGFPSGWIYDPPENFLLNASSTSEEMIINMTVANTSDHGQFNFSIQVTDGQGNPLPGMDPYPYTMEVSSVPYLVVSSIEYSLTSPSSRPLANSDIEVTVTVKNLSPFYAENVTLLLKDGEKVLDNRTMNITESTIGGGEMTEVFVISFSSAGIHTLAVEMIPNGTDWLGMEASSSIEMDVGLNPLLFILIGFIVLMVVFGIIVLMIVYDRIRYPAEISLSSLKEQLDKDKKGPEIGDIEDLDIGAVEPDRLYPTSPKKKGGEVKAQKAKPAKEGARKKGERSKLKPRAPPPRAPPPKATPKAAPKAAPKRETPAKPVATPVTATPAQPPKEAKAPMDDTGLRERIRDIERRVQEAKLKDIDVSSLEGRMKEAKRAYASREFSKAEGILDTIDRRIEDLIERREKARRIIRDAQAAIYGLKYTDTDISQPKSFLTRAENAYKNSDFTEAIKNGQKAKDRAEEMERINSGGGSFSAGASSGDDMDEDMDDVGGNDEDRL